MPRKKPGAPAFKAWTSVEILQELCLKWFWTRERRLPWFPGRWCDRSLKPRAEVWDVVLFGDFAEQLLTGAHRWPVEARAVRLWVLSHAARAAVARLAGIPEEHVGVVPRYELFPAAARVARSPVPGRPWEL